jgi:hypothetical protein
VLCCAVCACLQDVETLVITMHAAFEESFVRAEDLWAAYLVPPGPAPVSVRTGEQHCCCQHVACVIVLLCAEVLRYRALHQSACAQVRNTTAAPAAAAANLATGREGCSWLGLAAVRGYCTKNSSLCEQCVGVQADDRSTLVCSTVDCLQPSSRSINQSHVFLARGANHRGGPLSYHQGNPAVQRKHQQE